MIPLDKWMQRYVMLANVIASWSKDPSTKVGAVIVGMDRRQIAFGYNGFPPGVVDTSDRLNDRATRYKLTQHAERNALDQVAFNPRGGMMITTMFPCDECAKSIVTKGIQCVVAPKPLDREPWKTASEWTRLIFKEAGIKLIEY